MKAFQLTVFGRPVPQGSMSNFRGRMVSANQKLASWRESVAWTAQLQRPEPFARHQPLSASMLFVFARPRTAAKAQQQPAVRPDLDKLVRAVCDALTGILWPDDGQIVCFKDVRKEYGQPERAEISIEAVA